MDETAKNSVARKPSFSSLLIRWLVFAAVATIAIYAYRNYADVLTLSNLAEQEQELRSFQKASPAQVIGFAFLIYVAVTGLSLPIAGVLSLVFAWYFGFWRAVAIISFASTAGATIAFLLSRYLFRDTVQTRFAEKLTSFNQALETEGAFYLFTLRLIPAVPFVVINLVMGLTPMRATTYWWVSQLGMLPGTAVYVYAGSRFPDLRTLARDGTTGILTPQLIFALVLLGIFPLIVKKAIAKWRSNIGESEERQVFPR